MNITFNQQGDFKSLTNFLERAKGVAKLSTLDKYGKMGVSALKSVTPVDTGKTADSWTYKITRKKDSVTISFHNTNIQNGVPIAIVLQYGHGTSRGGWIQGRDYINPVIQPLFDEIVNNAWGEVTK